MHVLQIALPAIFICLAMTFSKIHPPVAQMPAMEIHPWLLTPQKMKDSHLYAFYRSVHTSSVAGHHDSNRSCVLLYAVIGDLR